MSNTVIIVIVIFSLLMTSIHVYALIQMWKDSIQNKFIRFFIISEGALRLVEDNEGRTKKKLKLFITLGTVFQLILIWIYVFVVLLSPLSISFLILIVILLNPFIVFILANIIHKKARS